MSSLRIVLLSAFLCSAAACGGSSTPSTPTSPSTGPTPAGSASTVGIPRGAETLGNRAYSPDDVTVAVGSTVTWTNGDGVEHTTTSDNGVWNSGIVPAGGRFSFTFQNAGTFTYRCTIHPGMIGTVTVTP